MTREELLHAWPEARRSHTAWLKLLSGDNTPEDIVRAAAAAVLEATDTANVAKTLIDEGEFDAIEYLLLDELVILDSDVARELDARRRMRMEEVLGDISLRAEELRQRADQLGKPFSTDYLLEAASRSQVEAERLVREQAERFRAAENRLSKALDLQLEAPISSDTPAIDVTQWRESVRQIIASGEFKAAQKAIAEGPRADEAPRWRLPQLPGDWLLGRPALDEVIDYYLDPDSQPLSIFAHRAFRLDRDDDDARGFLEATSRLLKSDNEGSRQAVVVMVARLLGCPASNVVSSPSAATMMLTSLKAPGFHALSDRRWPKGIPLTLTAPDATPDHNPGGLGVRLAHARTVSTMDAWLNLSLEEILAVLGDRHHRRDRLLLVLARQVPLAEAFAAVAYDELVPSRHRVLPTEDTLYVGAPGMGKASLVSHFVSQNGVRMHASEVGEADMPGQASCIVIDGADTLNERELRGLVREVYWWSKQRKSQVRIILMGRPETASLVERYAPGQFKNEPIGPLPMDELRAHAIMTLGWIGVQAIEPSLYSRLAMLASGNPTVLLFLCQALVALLRDDKRVFDAQTLDWAWRSEPFRERVRALLWVPLSQVPARVRLLRLIIDFVQPGQMVEDFSTLLDLISQEDQGEPQKDMWTQHLTILKQYGVIDINRDTVSRPHNGLSVLISEWLRAADENKSLSD